MIVYVVGGAGFLGRRIVKAFAEQGHDVVSVDINPPSVPVDFGPKVRSMRVDVTDFEQVMSTMSACKPDIAINLGFMRENLPRLAFKLNVLGMDNCLEAARLCNVRRVLYCSSLAVHGRQSNYGDRLILESEPTAPIKQYDVHKVFNEWQAKEYAGKHGMSVIGIRAANVSGTDKSIGSVDHVDCIVKPAMGQTVRFDYRDKMRCVIHGDDAAQVFARIALAPNPKYTIYNTGGEPLSLGNIADMVRKVIPDADIKFDHETGAREGSSAYLLGNQRLTSEFGFSYMPYEERIRQMIETVRSNGALG
jgi:nucleoside-diphosphate-sugar epimerase